MSKLTTMIFLLPMVMFLGITVAHAVEYKKAELSISLSAEWVEIPKDIIVEVQKILAKQSPDAAVVHYDYGFQLASSTNWLEYPYIVITILSTGRIPENELKKIEQISLQKSVEKFGEKLGSIVSGFQTGKLVFDKQNGIIWTRIDATITDIGPVSTLQAIIPTEKGTIVIGGASLLSDYPTYEPIFRSIALSALPAPELVYRPNWTDNVPTAIKRFNWVGTIAKVTFLVLLAGLFSLFRRKKEQSSQPSQDKTINESMSGENKIKLCEHVIKRLENDLAACNDKASKAKEIKNKLEKMKRSLEELKTEINTD